MKRILILAPLLLSGCHTNDGKCTEVATGRVLPARKMYDYGWKVRDENGIEAGIYAQNSNDWRCRYNDGTSA